MPIIPNDNDVLFGRGATIRSHPGNERLRSAVRARRPAFLEARREDKRDIARDIIDEIQESGGRFLVEAPELASSCSSALGQKPWVCADREKAVCKVMHRLREKEHGPEVATPTETPRSESCPQLGGATKTIRNPQLMVSGADAPAPPGASQDLSPRALALASSLRNMNQSAYNVTLYDGSRRAGSLPSENLAGNASVMHAQHGGPQALLQNVLRSIGNPSTLDNVGLAGAVPSGNLMGDGNGVNVQVSQLLRGLPPHALSGSLHNMMQSLCNSTLENNSTRTANAVPPGNLIDNVSGMNMQHAGINQALQGMPADALTRTLHSIMMQSIDNPIPVNVGRASSVPPGNLMGIAGTVNLQRAPPPVLQGMPPSALARLLRNMMQSRSSSALGNMTRAGTVLPGNLISNSSGMNVQHTLTKTLEGLHFNTLMGSLNRRMQFAGNNFALNAGRAGAVPAGSLTGNVMNANQSAIHQALQGLPPNSLTNALLNRAGATTNADGSDAQRQLIINALLDSRRSTQGPNDQRSQSYDHSNFQTMISHQTGSATARVGAGSTSGVVATHGARLREPGGTKRAAANPLHIEAMSSSSLQPTAKKRKGNLSGDVDGESSGEGC